MWRFKELCFLVYEQFQIYSKIYMYSVRFKISYSFRDYEIFGKFLIYNVRKLILYFSSIVLIVLFMYYQLIVLQLKVEDRY